MTRRQFCRGLLGATLALVACGDGKPGNGAPPRPRPAPQPTPPPPRPVPPSGDVITVHEADIRQWRTYEGATNYVAGTVTVRINGVIIPGFYEIEYG